MLQLLYISGHSYITTVGFSTAVPHQWAPCIVTNAAFSHIMPPLGAPFLFATLATES